MSTHTINHVLETDKFYLVENETGITKHINKNGEYIKKFNVELTGRVNHDERVALAKGVKNINKPNKKDNAFMPLSSNSLKKFPQFYIPQPDKFDAYAQLPRTLQDPFYNNERKRPQTTLDMTKSLLNGRSKNQKYGIAKPIPHITGTAKDLAQSRKQGEIEVLEMRHDTRREKNNRGVKKINNYLLPEPNTTKYREFRINYQSNSQLQQDSQISSQSQSQFVSAPQIVPLTEQQAQTMKSFNHIMREQQESKSFYHTKTFNNSQQSFALRSNNKQLVGMQDYEYILETQKKELQAFHLPIQKEKQKITSQGRFTVQVPENHYEQDRKIVKILQPDLFVQKDNPKKIQMEIQRRKLAKMKEAEMLQQNLKNKL